ncbi:unnamed protein product [Brassica oleracea var. botrytis]|uniref:Uncharacterized protein n=2 Tax=Brassica TaxID=3705 RepID=A0A0D3DUG1_BRAOL|nr:unnamed protein product [Brassica napus]
MSWTKITNELDKGKGHVFSYTEDMVALHKQGSSRFNVLSEGHLPSLNDDEADSSATNMSSASAPHVFPTGFQLGPSSGGRVSGNPNGSKTQRKRPPSWKRKAIINSSQGSPLSPSQPPSQTKMKSSPP